MPVENTGTGEAHSFQIPLTKIDVERRLVIGTAAEEVPDKSQEIMDYASARPQFEAWSKEFADATGGVSKGNLRVMHTKAVAGRLDDISYDDARKKVQIVAKVIDEGDWQKCLQGAYTGFSIGGGYLRKWKDPDGLTRYTPIIREISLVDNPCVPTAKFAELVKADGIVEQLELKGAPRGFAQQWADRPRGFDEQWTQRPRSFAELAKNMDVIVPGALGLGALGLGAAGLYLAHKEAHEKPIREAAAVAGFNRSTQPLFKHPDNSRLSDHEINHHMNGAMQAWDHHAAGNLDHTAAKKMADAHVAILLHAATTRMHEEHELDAQHENGTLTDKEHAERVAAAKARWDEEGGGEHMHLTHYNHAPVAKSVSSNAFAGTIEQDASGAAGIVGSLLRRRSAAAAGGLPSKGAATSSVRRKLGLGAPADPDLDPDPALGKGFWTSDKHPRGRGGQFSSKNGLRGVGASVLGRSGDMRAGFTVGSLLGNVLHDVRHKIHDQAAYGGGDSGSRNRFAAFLRHPKNADIRQSMQIRARKARLAAMGADTLSDRINGARRKIAEEQVARGGSMDGVHASADAWTRKLLARADRKGGPAAAAALRGAVSDGRAKLDEIRGRESNVASTMLDRDRLLSSAALGLAGAGVGTVLGEQSKARLEDEKAGRHVSLKRHILATAGDAVHLGSDILSGKKLGSLAGGAVTALAQAWRPTLRRPFQFDAEHLNLTEVGRNMQRAGNLGAVLGGTRATYELGPQYAARFRGRSKKDKH